MEKDRIQFEKSTVEMIIKLFCKDKHGCKGALCRECSELLDYAFDRLANCRFGVEKTVCANCKVHCYKQDMRKKIIDTMRYSAPRMMFSHPIVTVKYLKLKIKNR